MKAFFPIFRMFVVASLLLALSAATVCPRLAAFDGAGAAIERSPGGTVCCCGTNDGKCCGMACCVTPAPQQGSTPVSSNRSCERCEPWGLALAAPSKIADPAAAAFRDGVSSDAASAGSPSLIALNIRLNL
jgi:hypothetical protein